jgi:hypothetical protein
LRQLLRPAIATARWSLRAYAPPTLLIVAAAAAGVAAVVPALALAGPGAGHPELELLPGADLGIPLSGLASSPAALQQHGVAALSGTLGMLAIAGLVVSMATILALSILRGSRRRSELIVRRAVGATRGQLLLSGLAEGAVLVVLALGVGGGAGLIGVRWAGAAWPGTTGTPALVGPVISLVGLGALILLGMLLPIIGVRRAPLAGAPSAIPPGFVAATLQFGMAFAVLLVAGQLGRHADWLLGGPRTTPGQEGVILRIDTSGASPERATRYTALLDRLRRTRTFQIVSLSSPGALGGLGWVDVVVTDCGRCFQGGIATPLRAVPAVFNVVSPDSFRAMDIPVLEGRGVAPTDSWRSERVALVSRTLAAKHFEGGSAVGRRLQFGQGSGPWFTVVGVVEDRAPQGLGGGLLPPYAVYASVLQLPPSSAELLVRPIAGRRYDPQALRASVGVVGHVRREQTERQWRTVMAAPVRWFGRLVSLGGFLILGIAVLGAFAVIQLWVTALLPELAVRRAVGARRRDIFRHVISRAVGVGVVGVGFGLWVSEMMSVPVASAIAGLPDVDWGLVPRFALLLLAAALAGALIPAWRAARADPAALTAEVDIV